MLKKTARLVKQKDFDRTYRRGRTINHPDLMIKVVDNDKTINRFGIVVSNKIDKRATVRNRIKRQIRAILKKKEKEILPGHDLVLVV
ncbi:ribonuclease P protein component, partial [Candidatus Wolfebacteria bacterium RBG_13_41_7]